MRGTRPAIAALLIAACADPKPRVTFSNEPPGTARAYAVLKSGRDTSTKRWPGWEIHIAVAKGLTNADQQATIQHVIDSMVARDTSLLWLRVTAFEPEKPKPGVAEVPLYAALQGIWAPPDTSDPASRSHKAVHRVFFTVIPAPADTGGSR